MVRDAFCNGHMRFGIIPWVIVLSMIGLPSDAEPAGATPVEERERASVSDFQLDEAETYFREGVRLFVLKEFGEALTEFNRALATDAGMHKAVWMREGCLARLNGTRDAVERNLERIETLDAKSPMEDWLKGEVEDGIQWGANEHIAAAKEQLESRNLKGALIQLERLLLLEPHRKEADELLRLVWEEASMKASSLPPDDRGMEVRLLKELAALLEGERPQAISVRSLLDSASLKLAREKGPAATRMDAMNELLDYHVSVVFEKIHLSEILEYLSDYYEVNFVVDQRALAPLDDSWGDIVTARPAGRGGRRGGFGSGGGFGAGLGALTPAIPAPKKGEPFVTDGIVDLVRLRDVPMRDFLSAILLPIDLDYVAYPHFVWISSRDRAREGMYGELASLKLWLGGPMDTPVAAVEEAALVKTFSGTEAGLTALDEKVNTWVRSISGQASIEDILVTTRPSTDGSGPSAVLYTILYHVENGDQ